MGSKTRPIFPMPGSQHYSDYGFDSQFDYFQVLEEARRHGKRGETRGTIEGHHFKLQKPISKDDSRARSKKRKQWWKTAFLFWKRKNARGNENNRMDSGHRDSTHRAVSGPLYLTESLGSGTPCRSNRSGSGPLRFSPAERAGIPYLNLRESNVIESHRVSATSAHPHVPVYLVT
ncbi:uncharacterized protein LOC120253594 [Dioscorea cayenensis subsp. rotundata]|uniref:Uncharacterized protein LOC120253594 n=1 Tax=Dioscorea cayennensis subsp. rotundata TaxID=55577 RepID=A0AB40ATA1_DIOCR|nr:uncharacterized protein LOC120253594 [Dioscorea cayenensis subsp. rotundata]